MKTFNHSAPVNLWHKLVVLILAAFVSIQTFAAGITQVNIVSGSSGNYVLKIKGSCAVNQGQTKLYISTVTSGFIVGTNTWLLGLGNGTCSGQQAGTQRTVILKTNRPAGSYYFYMKQGGTITPFTGNPVVLP
jgi:hypothetical protein